MERGDRNYGFYDKWGRNSLQRRALIILEKYTDKRYIITRIRKITRKGSGFYGEKGIYI